MEWKKYSDHKPPMNKGDFYLYSNGIYAGICNVNPYGELTDGSCCCDRVVLTDDEYWVHRDELLQSLPNQPERLSEKTSKEDAIV